MSNSSKVILHNTIHQLLSNHHSPLGMPPPTRHRRHQPVLTVSLFTAQRRSQGAQDDRELGVEGAGLLVAVDAPQLVVEGAAGVGVTVGGVWVDGVGGRAGRPFHALLHTIREPLHVDSRDAENDGHQVFKGSFWWLASD